MPFVDTNSHLTTKPSNFDIKCQSNSESYDQHGFLVTKFMGGGMVRILYQRLEVFSRRGSTLLLTGWSLSYTNHTWRPIKTDRASKCCRHAFLRQHKVSVHFPESSIFKEKVDHSFFFATNFSLTLLYEEKYYPEILSAQNNPAWCQLHPRLFIKKYIFNKH